MTDKATEMGQSYEVVSVRPAETPPGTEGANWYSYVIAFCGNDSIHGCRQGNLRAVTGEVEEIVDQLNARHKGKYGRVHLVPTPKKVPTTTG